MRLTSDGDASHQPELQAIQPHALLGSRTLASSVGTERWTGLNEPVDLGA